MYATPHGGSCCGMMHLRGMSAHLGQHDEQSYEREMKRHIAASLPTHNSNRVVEVTMTDDQLRTPWIPGVLRRCGFKLVNRFRNSNSGNNVNVFHRIKKSLSMAVEDLPFEWGPPILPPSFHRVYNGRRMSTGYETLERALAGAQLHLERIDRLVDGEFVETVWTKES